MGKCCGLIKSEVKPAKQIVKNGKILNFYASFRIRKVFDWSVGNSYVNGLRINYIRKYNTGEDV